MRTAGVRSRAVCRGFFVQRRERVRPAEQGEHSIFATGSTVQERTAERRPRSMRIARPVRALIRVSLFSSAHHLAQSSDSSTRPSHARATNVIGACSRIYTSRRAVMSTLHLRRLSYQHALSTTPRPCISHGQLSRVTQAIKIVKTGSTTFCQAVRQRRAASRLYHADSRPAISWHLVLSCLRSQRSALA